MPLRDYNTRILHRRTYGGNMVKITLLKRGDDQAMGTVTSYTLFQCRIRSRQHTGEPIRTSLAAGDRSEWMVPACELARVGIDHINALDRIVGPDGQVWQPEAPEGIHIRLFTNIISIPVRRAKD